MGLRGHTWTAPARARGLIAGAAAILLGGLTAVPATALPVTIAPISLATHEHSYPTDGGAATWRVVHDASGNPFENYVAVGPTGDLYNFGGSYLRHSSDAGQTWTEIRTIEPVLSGEGAVTVAPNGDVLAVGWDPYSGDRVMAFKFDAAAKKWDYTETVLHTPFFDRPWLAVLPGPIHTRLGTVPYVAMLRGGAPSKDVVYYAVDGLNYALADVPGTSREVVPQELSVGRASYADWTQPHTRSTITPLPPVGGGLHALQNREGNFTSCTSWRALTARELQWGCLNPERGVPDTGRMVVDSDGRLHHISIVRASNDPDADVAPADSFTYSISTDGGRTWGETTTVLPPGMSVDELDFKAAGGALDLTAVSIHAQAPKSDHDFLYKFGTGTGAPVRQRFYRLGEGDKDFGGNASSLDDRFDFSSVAIMPNGKLVVSFADSSHVEAALAIEP